eukprot:scpid54960/ scgid13102/ 
MADHNGSTVGRGRGHFVPHPGMPTNVRPGMRMPSPQMVFPPDIPPGVCRYFVIGRCAYNEKCWLRHPAEMRQRSPSSSEASASSTMAAPLGNGVMMMHAPGGAAYYPGVPNAAAAMANPAMGVPHGQPRPTRQYRPSKRGGGPPMEKLDVPCRYVGAPQGCRNGEYCRYKHDGKAKPAQTATSPPVAAAGQATDTTTTDTSSSTTEQAVMSSSDGNGTASADAANTGNADGVVNGNGNGHGSAVSQDATAEAQPADASDDAIAAIESLAISGQQQQADTDSSSSPTQPNGEATTQ